MRTQTLACGGRVVQCDPLRMHCSGPLYITEYNLSPIVTDMLALGQGKAGQVRY
jgi:hypothetical protein